MYEYVWVTGLHFVYWFVHPHLYSGSGGLLSVRRVVVYLCVGMDCLVFFGGYGFVSISSLVYTLRLIQAPISDCSKTSMDIGAATSASAAWVPETTIKVLGRWQSMACQQYVRSSVATLATVAPHLLAPTQ